MAAAVALSPAPLSLAAPSVRLLAGVVAGWSTTQAALCHSIAPSFCSGNATWYHEHITENFQRLTDSEWLDELSAQTPPDVAWMQDLVVR
jgi:hypothetical protein